MRKDSNIFVQRLCWYGDRVIYSSSSNSNIRIGLRNYYCWKRDKSFFVRRLSKGIIGIEHFAAAGPSSTCCTVPFPAHTTMWYTTARYSPYEATVTLMKRKQAAFLTKDIHLRTGDAPHIHLRTWQGPFSWIKSMDISDQSEHWQNARLKRGNLAETATEWDNVNRELFSLLCLTVGKAGKLRADIIRTIKY